MNIRLLSHHVVIFHENCVNLIYVAEKREMIRADMMRVGRIIVGQVKKQKSSTTNGGDEHFYYNRHF